MISLAIKNSFFRETRLFLCICMLFLSSTVSFAAIPGDVNDDGTDDLADVIIAMRLACDIPLDEEISIQLEADVDADGKIGVAEAVYVLRLIAGFCLITEEAELVRLINEYRKENSLSELSVSKSLSDVARLHVRDLQSNNPHEGDCSMHSWSDQGDWTPFCYLGTPESWALMQSKPGEITDDIYTEAGFELAYFYSPQITAQLSLDEWKESPSHNEVILEQGIWTVKKWAVMGVGIYENYAVVWFGEGEDPAGTIPECGN